MQWNCSYFSENSKEGWLAAAVRTANEDVHSRLHLKREFLDEHVSVGGDERNFVETNQIVCIHDLSRPEGEWRRNHSIFNEIYSSQNAGRCSYSRHCTGLIKTLVNKKGLRLVSECYTSLLIPTLMYESKPIVWRERERGREYECYYK